MKRQRLDEKFALYVTDKCDYAVLSNENKGAEYDKKDNKNR